MRRRSPLLKHNRVDWPNDLAATKRLINHCPFALANEEPPWPGIFRSDSRLQKLACRAQSEVRAEIRRFGLLATLDPRTDRQLSSEQRPGPFPSESELPGSTQLAMETDANNWCRLVHLGHEANVAAFAPYQPGRK